MKFLLPLASLLFLTAFARADIEGEVLQEINLARTSPQQYAQFVAEYFGRASGDAAEAIRFLNRARPLAALQRSSGLGLGAQMHVDYQGPSGGRGHGSGRDGAFARINQYGSWSGAAGENIYYGRHDARGIVCALIVDRGVRGRGHRKNLFSPNYGVAGVAYGHHSAYGAMCVIDFAGRYAERGATVASL